MGAVAIGVLHGNQFAAVVVEVLGHWVPPIEDVGECSAGNSGSNTGKCW